MIDLIVGPESILPYSGDMHATVSPRRPFSGRAYLIRPWVYAGGLLVCGASIAMSAPPAANVRHAPHSMSPVVVMAPTPAEWTVMKRREMVARMLINKRVDSANAARWARAFVYYGEQVHVNPRLLVAIAYAESEFNPSAYSSAGAIGLMQVLPERASWMEYEPNCGRMTPQNLHKPLVNICFGAHIFKEFLTRHHGDTDHALAAYNNGSGELNSYPDRVYASMAALRH
jgi:soluble lytic murein transglycosylase-like protein